MAILSAFQSNQKKLAILIDPDKSDESYLNLLLESVSGDVGKQVIFFVGGSILFQDRCDEVIASIREQSDCPVVIFPGANSCINDKADAFLLLSLISGRNPEWLIGKHVMSAPALKQSGLEVIPTAYMLISSGKPTTVHYISNTQPIPSDKAEIAVATAMAGELLGMKCCYLEAGSGAESPVPATMIKQVKKAVSVPVFVGGGIDSVEKANTAFDAGADLIVIGNAFEKKPEFLKEIINHLKNR